MDTKPQNPSGALQWHTLAAKAIEVRPSKVAAQYRLTVLPLCIAR
jgi:hypothetical protein